MVRRTSVVAAVLAATSLLVTAQAGAADTWCQVHFPDVSWEMAGETELLTVATAGMAEAQGLRYAEEASATVRMLEADLGSFAQLHLCVAGRQVAIESAGILPPGQSLHAVAFTEDGTVFIGPHEALFFDEASAFGLAYAALSQVAAAAGDTGYPEPLATTIGQWYLSRVAGKEELHHSQMRSGAFFTDPEGQGVAATDWTSETQPPVYPWNPQFQESPAADLIGFAVAREGTAVLRNPSNEQWRALEVAWQAALRNEALQGSGSGNEWMVGLAIALGLIGLAITVAMLDRRSRRRFKDEARLPGRRRRFSGGTGP